MGFTISTMRALYCWEICVLVAAAATMRYTRDTASDLLKSDITSTEQIAKASSRALPAIPGWGPIQLDDATTETLENGRQVETLAETFKSTLDLSNEDHGWGIGQHVKYYFHCRHLGYYYVNFRWQVLKIATEVDLKYKNVENADVFSEKSQWGNHPIEFGGIFHHGFCIPTPHMICSYRLSGAFEGALYPHINIAQMEFIDDRQNPLRSSTVHPTVTESCMTYDVDAAPFCANGLGEQCRLIHVKIDRPIGVNAKVVQADTTSKQFTILVA